MHALKRGVPQGAILDSIDDVIQILESEGMLTVFNNVAHPVRRQTNRARSIVNQAATCDDPVVRRVRALRS